MRVSSSGSASGAPSVIEDDRAPSRAGEPPAPASSPADAHARRQGGGRMRRNLFNMFKRDGDGRGASAPDQTGRGPVNELQANVHEWLEGVRQAEAHTLPDHTDQGFYAPSDRGFPADERPNRQAPQSPQARIRWLDDEITRLTKRFGSTRRPVAPHDATPLLLRINELHRERDSLLQEIRSNDHAGWDRGRQQTGSYRWNHPEPNYVTVKKPRSWLGTTRDVVTIAVGTTAFVGLAALAGPPGWAALAVAGTGAACAGAYLAGRWLWNRYRERDRW